MDASERGSGSGRTHGVSFWPFLNSSGWCWLISSVFLIRISCHKKTHANGYYGTWPGWAVSISVLPLTVPSNHLILCHPLLLPPSIFPIIRVFFNESALHIRWPKYWSFSFNISPSEEWINLSKLTQWHSSQAGIPCVSCFRAECFLPLCKSQASGHAMSA